MESARPVPWWLLCLLLLAWLAEPLHAQCHTHLECNAHLASVFGHTPSGHSVLHSPKVMCVSGQCQCVDPLLQYDPVDRQCRFRCLSNRDCALDVSLYPHLAQLEPSQCQGGVCRCVPPLRPALSDLPSRICQNDSTWPVRWTWLSVSLTALAVALGALALLAPLYIMLGHHRTYLRLSQSVSHI